MSSSNKRVAIYARCACRLQNQSNLPAQVTHVKRHAHVLGWSIVGTFSDDGASGMDTSRPGYQRLCSAIQSGAVDVILTEDLSRLTRNQDEIVRLLDLCQQHDVALETISEGAIEAWVW